MASQAASAESGCGSRNPGPPVPQADICSPISTLQEFGQKIKPVFFARPLQSQCKKKSNSCRPLNGMKFRLYSRVREQSRVEERSIKFSAVTDKVITRVPYTVTRVYFLRLLIYDMGSWIQRTPGQ